MNMARNNLILEMTLNQVKWKKILYVAVLEIFWMRLCCFCYKLNSKFMCYNMYFLSKGMQFKWACPLFHMIMTFSLYCNLLN